MKKILLACALFVSIAATAQKSGNAPDAAKKAFTKNYPGATKVTWEKEDGNYEVSFIRNGRKGSVIYDSKGVLLESEDEMNVSDLPVSIAAYMKEHYKGYVVKSAAKITTAAGMVNYEAEIKGKDVLFDSNGKFLKEVKE